MSLQSSHRIENSLPYPKSWQKHQLLSYSNILLISIMNSQRIPKKFPKNFKRIIKEFQKYSKRIPKEIFKNSQKIPKEFQKNYKRISKVFQKNFQRNLQKFPKNSKIFTHVNFPLTYIALKGRKPYWACFTY